MEKIDTDYRSMQSLNRLNFLSNVIRLKDIYYRPGIVLWMAKRHSFWCYCSRSPFFQPATISIQKLLIPRPNDRNISQHCWPSICKLRPNDRNMWTKHIVTLLGATCFVCLATLSWHVELVCTNLAKQLQHHATSTNVARKSWPFSILTKQHPTCRNRVAKRAWHSAPNNAAICCVEMLLSFCCHWCCLKFWFFSIDFFCLIRIPVQTHTGWFTIKRLENPLHSEWIRTSHKTIQPRSLGLWQGPLTKKQQPVLLRPVLADLRNSSSIMKSSYNKKHSFHCTAFSIWLYKLIKSALEQ